jgi:eukaryotic-like serine/threonine-protein kinase
MLRADQKLGPYVILSPLGRGGMGEVWRARDSRLGRDVAIKISDQQFSDRFEREARAIAALNHPNICTLHDVGPNYLVMEIVEGPTLAERISKGPLPLDEALVIAGQIAEALDAAHEKGIIHRDLKPANIKIRPDGSVKVLDFGLAKSVVDPAKVTSDSPTLMHPTVGLILGTAGYMSPEQARGQDVDTRSDIWAFGVVLFEMTTGRRLFGGATVTDCLAAILKDSPDLTEAPPTIQRLLASCLQKDPRKRLRDIGDWQRLLEPLPSAAPGSKRSSILPWAVAAAAILAVIGLGAVAWIHFTAQSQVLRLTLQIPEKTRLISRSALLAISPDGRRVGFVAQIDGKSGLWLRDLDGPGTRLLPGTEDADSWFWSPDSRWIAFFADAKLKKIDVTGGPPLILCDANGVGGAWSQEGWIIFVRYAGGLSLIPDTGGTPTPLTKPDPAGYEIVHRAPWFLPDGRHFLYTARSADHDMTRVYVDSIEARPGTVTRREVLAVHSNVAYVPRIGGGLFGSANDGYLLFGRESTLMAQPFDASHARTTGDAVPLVEQVDYFPGIAHSQFSASTNGILVYTSGAPRGTSMQLTWFDRTGKPGGVVGDPSKLARAWISPDGSAVATDGSDDLGVSSIWLHDLARGTASRFTFGSTSSQFPVWSPDGSRVAFWRPTVETLQKAVSGTGQEELLYKDPWNRTTILNNWSSDGRYLLFGVFDPGKGFGLDAVPMFGDRKPFTYLNADSNNGEQVKLSRDGAFLAYTSGELKRTEVYVQTFPDHTGKWQVSTGGGDWPVWSRDGRELYFLSGDGKMMAVEVKISGRTFEAGVPKVLFSVPGRNQFDVGKDGRFLIQVPQAQTTESVSINVVVNWQSALKK